MTKTFLQTSTSFFTAARPLALRVGLGVVLLVGVVGLSAGPARAASFLSSYVVSWAAGYVIGGIADAAQATADNVCPGVCHDCNTDECTDASTTYSYSAKQTINEEISDFTDMMEDYFDDVKGELTKLANQGSNNVQNFTNSVSGLNDNLLASQTASAMSESRVLNSARLVPSTSACRLASRDRALMGAEMMMRVGTGGIGSGALYSQSQRDGTDYAANLSGGPTANGALQASKSSFDDTLNGFCDSSVLVPPTGMTCSLVNDREGKPMSFRFVQPYSALFGVKDNYIPASATDPENRAARLFVRFAIEPVPIDPLRGQMLIRSDGRSAFLQRQSDIAAMNLARGALDRMVDDRLENASLGTSPSGNPQSLQSVRMLAWADFDTAMEDAKRRAEQPTGSNYDDLGPLVGDVNKIYLQLYNNLERLSAIKAVRLARLVEKSSAGSQGVSTQPIQN